MAGMTETQARRIATRIGRFDGCAYIYRDGVVFSERVEVKGSTRTLHKYTLVQAEIEIRGTRYGTDSRISPERVDRIVVSDPAVLAHGVESVEIAFDNSSPHMVEKGITCTTITLRTPKGGRFDFNEFDFISGTFTPQPDKFVLDPGTSAADFIARARDNGDIIGTTIRA